MVKKLIDFLRDEDGQTSTEYILLVAVVALIVFKFKDVALDKLVGPNGIVSKVFGKTDSFVDEIN